VVIGIGGLIVPQALGVGYDVIGAELSGHIGLRLVVGLLVVKTVIWSLSLGSGTSGGVLAPMFMIGGALGCLEAHVFPTVGPGFWALVALAGVLGGVMRSPFTGVVFAVELTHRLDAVLPLMISASTAYAVSVLTLRRSVLTEKIARRGYHLTREYDMDPLEPMFVDDVLDTDVLVFAADEPADAALAAVSGNDPATAGHRRQQMYPVVDAPGRLLGVVRRSALEAAVHAGGGDRSVLELAERQPVVAHGDDTLRTVAITMAEHDVDRLPVVARDDTARVVGIVTLTALLAGRLRDLHEAQHREKVLRLRVVRSRRQRDAGSELPVL